MNGGTVYLWGRWTPSRLLVGSFGAVIAVGTLLLRLPVATHGAPLSWIDALFTATSAACVTGLVVVDTGFTLSGFGQAVVFGLFQMGGIGIMTFSTLGLVLLGKRLELPGRQLVSSRLRADSPGDLARLLKRVVLAVAVFETAGALILAARWPAESWGEAIWGGAFHAVSAFCNAGFGLFPDSLVRFRGDAVVVATVMALIVIGGLGFPVLLELLQRLGRRPPRRRSILSVHTKVVLLVTATLLLLGTVAILVFERDHVLRGLAPADRWLAAAFQAVTPRTAGFNTLSIDALHPTTLFTLMALMFIGGSPGSTAGGIKTTALGVLAAFVWARARGRDTVDLFRRTIPEADLRRAVTVAATGILVVFLGVLALLITESTWGVAGALGVDQPMFPTGMTQHGFFLEVLFEAVSALGTVGLSTGITPSLSGPGRLIVVVLMFAGRLGPLTLAVAVGQARSRGTYRYPEERLIVG